MSHFIVNSGMNIYIKVIVTNKKYGEPRANKSHNVYGNNGDIEFPLELISTAVMIFTSKFRLQLN